MKTNKTVLGLAIIALAALMLAGVHSARAQGTKFTYQGRLLDAGSPASGNYDLRFSVWDAAGGGLQVGGSVVVDPVAVSSGLFTVPLDFGGGVFTGPQRWLQIESRLSGIGVYSTIATRQELTASPYAIAAGNFTGTLPGSQLSGTVPDARLSANVALLNRNPQTFTGQNSFNNNVGIGSGAAPAVVLDVFGTQSINGTSDGIVNIGSTAGFHVTLDDNEIHARLGASSSDLFVNDFGGTVYIAARAITALSAGNVGIGTSSPGAKLDVNGDTIVRGNLSFSDQASSIQFPATAGPNTPMISMFASGSGNADRMVIAHSPAFTSYGLQYQDSGDKFNFLSAGTAVMTVDLGSQTVGIGTTTPTKAKVEINGVAGSTPFGPTYGLLTTSGASSVNFSGTDSQTSLYASGNIYAGYYVAFSDERIKHSKGRSDAGRDLRTLLGIEVTDYTYIDTLSKGAGKYKKVIAQQVEKVYPQAVSRTTDVVPDIFQKAEVKDGWVKLATNLKKGEHVRLLGEKTEGIHEVLEIAEGKFRTDFAADGDNVFVYGREVKDFRNVDYEAIAMLNVSASQELNRRVEKQAAEIATLEKANADMKKELAVQQELTSRMEARFATMEKVVARLGKKGGTTLVTANH